MFNKMVTPTGDNNGYTNCDHGTATASHVRGQDTVITFKKPFTPKVIVVQTSGGTYQALNVWSDAQPTTTLYNSTYNNTSTRVAISAGDTNNATAIISTSVTNNGFSVSSIQVESWGYGDAIEWYACGE